MLMYSHCTNLKRFAVLYEYSLKAGQTFVFSLTLLLVLLS